MPSSKTSHNSADCNMAIVCCIEAGPLEQQVILLASTLQHFGKETASTPIIAVRPRKGPAISRATYKALTKLGVQIIESESSRQYSWNNFMNKPNALLLAEKHSDAEVICWLDSDIIVAGDISRLQIPDFDFSACAPDKNVGSEGTHDENDPYWISILNTLEINVDSLPFVTTQLEGTPIRWYFNSGVFSYKKDTGFAQAFLDDCTRILDARIASVNAGIFFTDQVAMGLTAHRLGLSFDILPHEYNRAYGSRSELPLIEETKNTRIIHYHDALWPHYWPTFMEHLASCRPDVWSHVTKAGPLTSGPLRISLHNKVLKKIRNRKLHRHMASCSIV